MKMLFHYALMAAVLVAFCVSVSSASQHTVVFTMDAAATAHHHPAYPASPSAVVELGTDCEFAWAYLKANSPDGASAYMTASTYITSTPTDWTLPANQGMTLAYVPFDEHIPAHSTILSAKLCIIAKSGWYMGARDSLMVTNLHDVTDVPWWTSKGVGENPNQAHASWDHPVQGWEDGPNSSLLQARGYPERSVGTWPWLESGFHLWDLGRSQMSRFRGDECCGDGYRDEDCGWASFLNGHDIEIEMRRLVQAVVNGEENEGHVLVNLTGGDAPATSYYHWDTNAIGGELGGEASEYAPFWVVTYSDAPFQPYLPDGHEGAMVFSTDDGTKNANFQFAQAYADAGLPPSFAVYLAEVHVAAGSQKLTFDDLVTLRNMGVEIGSHSRWHDGDPDTPRDGLTVYDPHDYGVVCDYHRGMPSEELTCNATGWDSLLVDTDPVWLYEGMAEAAGRSFLDDPYVGKGLAFPSHCFDLPVVRALCYHDYRYFRCGESLVQYTNPEQNAYLRRFTLVHQECMYAPSDSVRVFCPTNSEPFNAMGMPLTLSFNQLELNVAHDEASVKTWARQRMESLMAQDLAGGILNVYTHDVPEGGTGWYEANLDPQWLTWILEEYLDMGIVWIARPRDMNDWIRSTHAAAATPEEWLVDDAWRWTVDDAVLVAGGGVPVIVGIGEDPPCGPGGSLPYAPTCFGAHPNPFNPLTTVEFELTHCCTTRLCVHDLMGHVVKRLVCRPMTAGRHQAVWDGTDERGAAMPSGMYLFRVSTEDGSDTQKMMLMR